MTLDETDQAALAALPPPVRVALEAAAIRFAADAEEIVIALLMYGVPPHQILATLEDLCVAFVPILTAQLLALDAALLTTGRAPL